MTILKILSSLALLLAAGWTAFDPSFESFLSLIGALSALISLFAFDYIHASKNRQRQDVRNHSAGIQAGGNVNIGTGVKDRDEK